MSRFQTRYLFLGVPCQNLEVSTEGGSRASRTSSSPVAPVAPKTVMCMAEPSFPFRSCVAALDFRSALLHRSHPQCGALTFGQAESLQTSLSGREEGVFFCLLEIA